jgi:WD40 repeat protein
VSGGDDATVRVWDLESRELLHQPLRGHDGEVNALALGELHGRAIVASGANDRTVRLWDLVSGQSVGAELRGHRRRVRAVAIGEVRGRPIVVSGSNDNTLRVWDLDSGRLLYEPLVGHHGNVTAIAVGELRGRAIAVSGSEDFTLRVWDLEAGGPLGALEGHEGFVHAVALGELGGRPIAVSGGDDKTVRVWALDTGGALGRPLRGHRDWVTAVAAGELGGRLIAVSGGIDQTVRVWDLEKAGPLGEPLAGHEGWVSAVAVGTIGDRSIAVSGGDDNTVRTWDLSAGGPLGRPLRHPRGVNAVAVGELQGGPPPASGETHRDTDEPAAWRVATDRRRDEETAPKPGVADPSTSPESVTAGASASSMPSPKRGALMRPGVQPPGREARREPRWPSALVGLVFSVMLLGGLVLVVFAVRDLMDLVNSPSSNRRADGVVIRVEDVTCGSGSNKSTCHYPVVRFVTARGEVIEFTSNLDVGYGAGDSVKVRYDPENPRHARLDSLRARVGSAVLDVVGVLGGLILTLVGGLLLWGVVRGEPRAGLDRLAARRPRRVGDRGSGGDAAGSTPAH